MVYHMSRKQPHICLRGGVRFPTGGIVRERREPQRMNRCDSGTDSIVWMREGVYGIFVMLFFDAYTLEGNFPGVYHQEGVFFL